MNKLDLARSTEEDRRLYLQYLVQSLLDLHEDGVTHGFIFIVGKWNTIDIDGREYGLKVEERN